MNARETADRRVLVTGGSRGIGAAIVHELAARGARVVLTYQSDVDAAEAVVARAASLPGSVSAVRHDLADGEPSELFAAVTHEVGGVDSLILNAGIWRGGRLESIPEEDWWAVAEANLRGNARLVRAGLPCLRQSSAGSITLISSAVAIVGFPGDTAYASSKSAMIGFARSLAKEVGPAGIRVNVLAPGFVETDMTAQVDERARARVADRSLLRRFGRPEEIARAAVFLSEEATYATGVVLPIDGGWTL